MKQRDPRCLLWLIPLALAATATLVIRVFDLDMRIARDAFAAGNNSFAANETEFSGFLYHAAPWPAFAIAAASLVVLVLGLRIPSWREHRRAAAILLLALAIGPVLIVNVGLKEHFGRPRPSKIEELGGSNAFQPVLLPGNGRDGHSFPSGHAAVGYYLSVPFFVFWNRRRALAWWFLGLGITWGSLIGFTRIVQGSHWLSDVLWSAAIVYFTGWALARMSGFLPRQDSRA